ncbi:MAG TPA: class I SAM-dependent methyltransferase [Chthoniobacterales bacterium]|jgi:ubiquinone/menaquinone biosynthesis C-methylase UbiE|nr:class I SAM-dependent methyltransferase [Chthoniobacterales bacterium]
MPPSAIATERRPAETAALPPERTSSESSDSLFERVAWLYAFCREHVFRDDTKRIISAVWPNQVPPAGTRVIELGCGPGFYSRNLAQRFPQIRVTGVDRSSSQLRSARHRAAAQNVTNCVFERVNALALPFEDASFNVLIASRIFTVLPDHRRAVAEMFRVLKPGGRCFIAEPRHAFWASLPLTTMWLLARVLHSGNGYREPKKATVLDGEHFADLFRRDPWKSIRVWKEGRYQYALCERG